MNQSDRVVLGFLTGAAIGGVLALLYAPDKGEVTRARLREQAKTYGEDMNQRLAQAKKDLTASAKSSKESLDARIEETLTQASYKADEIIASLENKLAELRKKNEKYREKKAVPKVSKA